MVVTCFMCFALKVCRTATVDSPETERPPDLRKIRHFEDFLCTREDKLYDSATIAARTRHFQELSELRIPAFEDCRLQV
jgi:hypothetical protein